MADLAELDRLLRGLAGQGGGDPKLDEVKRKVGFLPAAKS
jgi:hypothetical protein